MNEWMNETVTTS